MYYLVYLSTAKKLMGTSELENLMEVSRLNNDKKNITGMLLYADGSIIQLIEGEKDSVYSIYEKILQDPRHTGIIKLKEGELNERNFSHWSMAFEHVSESQMSKLVGYINIKGQEMISSMDINNKHPAIAFLKSFIKHNVINKDY